MTDRMGIVGLGDLGGRLALQAHSAGIKVIGYDVREKPVPALAVDPAIDTSELAWPPKIVGSVQEVADSAEMLHWCAPLETLPDGASMSRLERLVLHNSVMAQSVEARSRLLGSGFGGQVEIVHCLMNPERRVVVADDFGNSNTVVDHIRELGLAPKAMSFQRHDSIMASSQGIFALLINHGLREKLKAWNDDGLLTSSAHELLKAIENREANWTDVTVKAILTNPALKTFVKEIIEDLKDNNDAPHKA